MASIINERDLLLQNSTQRAVDVTLPSNVVPPALKAVTLSAPSTTFRVATDNSSSPSAITLNANLRAISGTPTMTWSVTPTGAATLTGTDYGVRTLTYANMAQDYCTVRVEVNDGGMIYFDETSFAKVRDGSKGVDGRRGSISAVKAVTGSTWSDAQALQALVDLGISTPLATDTVTLYNASTSYAEMRRYSGTAWVAVEASLPGSLLMDGSLGLTKFASGLEPVKVVSTLPTTKASNTVFLTSDSKLYRWNGTEYTKAVDGADIEANSITSGQIAAGAIKTDELDALAVTAAKIATGAVTADKVTAGAITTEKLLVTGLGIALNPDPNTQDISAWTGTGLSIVTDTTSPSGSTALECTGLAAAVLSKKFPIDPTKNYKARFWTKRQSGTSTTYGTVAFYDASGNVITGSSNGAGWPGRGSFHYFGLVNGALPAAWTEYSISFGPDETAVLPSNARFMAIGVLSNYTGTGVQRVAAPLVHLKTTGDMVVDGTITAGKIDARGLSIKDSAGNVILAAGTALSSEFVNPDAGWLNSNLVPSINTAATTATWSGVTGADKPLDNAGRVLDTRSVNNGPSTYGVGNTREFKTCSVIGLTTSATYCVVETIKGWGDSSGGEATQWAYVTSGEVWKRSAGNGATSWGSWVRDIDRSVYTGDLEANKTYVDGSGSIQGVSSGSGTSVNNAVAISAITSVSGGLLPNWNLDLADASGKPAGLAAVEGIADNSGIAFGDSTNSWVNISHATDTTIGYGFPAIAIDDSQVYTVTVRHKTNSATPPTTGLYLYFSELNTILPQGKTHLGVQPAAAVVADRSSTVYSYNSGPYPNNSGWTTQTLTYVPTAGTKFASFCIASWGNAVSTQYHVDAVYVVPKSATLYRQAAQPSGGTYVKGDTWIDSDSSPLATYVYDGSAWQVSGNYTTNTNQLTDGAGLGSTAVWGSVSGTGKPADNANKTSVDGNGALQGVASGAGTVVSNNLIGINASGQLYGAGAGNGTTISNNQVYIDSAGAVQGIGTGAGLSIANNTDSVIRAPGGGVFTTQTSSITGRMKITLPQSWTNTMLRFTVEVYEFSAGYMCTLEIGGYTYSPDSTWYNVTARVIGGSNVEYPVYFGHDGTKCCIWVGAATNETWSYPQVRVRDFFAGYSNYSRAQWESGWAISFDQTAITSGTGANQYSASVLDTLPGADWAKISGTNKPADGANRTYLDASGQLQGVSGGAGTTVSNSYIGINASGELYGAGAGNGIKVSNNQIYIDGSGAVQGIGSGSGTQVANSTLVPTINAAATTATWSNVSGAGKPADGATKGATFGVDIGGKITPSNISTYIADLAVDTLRIKDNAVTESVGFSGSQYSYNMTTDTSHIPTVSGMKYNTLPNPIILASAVLSISGLRYSFLSNNTWYGYAAGDCYFALYVLPETSPGVYNTDIAPAYIYQTFYDMGDSANTTRFKLALHSASAPVSNTGNVKFVLVFIDWELDAADRTSFISVSCQGGFILGTKK